MTTTVGQIGLNLVLNNTSFNKQLNSIQTQAKTVSDRVSSQFKKIGVAVAAAFSAKAIAAFGKDCIDLGSDLAEVQNVVDVTFTSMSEKVNQWAKDAAASYGLSETMAKKFTGTFGAMSKAFGFSEQQAYEMSTSLTGLAGDVASFYNITQDEAYTKLKSVFTGETESLKELGVVMTQNALDAYALANGYGKTTSAMTEAEKVSLRYAFVQKQLSAAQGDFTRTSDGWANQVRVLQLRFDSLKATIGQGLINAFTPVIKMINSLVERLTTVSNKFKALTEQIFGNAGSTSASISDTAASVSSLTDNANESSTALDGIADSAEKAKRSVAGFDKLNILSSNSSNNSSGETANNAPASSSGLSSVVESTTKGINDKLKNVFKNLYENSGFKEFVDNIQKGIEKVNWSSIGDDCKSIFNNMIPIAKTSLQAVQKVGKSAFGALGSAVGSFVSVSGKSLQTVTGGVAKWLEKDKKKIQDFITTIGDNFSSGFDNLSIYYKKLGDLIGGSIDRMRPKMEESISNLLSGLTTFAGSVGEIVSGAFNIATESLVEWIENDGAVIGEFFDNLQNSAAQLWDFFGQIFGDIGTIISDWWNGENGGAVIFKNVCDMFTNIGTTLMNVYNQWIKPVFDFFVSVAKSVWDNCLKPIFEQGIKFFGKVWDCISTLWNNCLSPIVNWIIDFVKPVLINALNIIKGVIDTVFSFIGEIMSSIMKSLGGLLDFITGIFTGDWEKAWQGISDFLGGIWDGIWNLIKTIINLIIDGINALWSGIYTAVQGIVNAIGGISGAIGDLFGQDWHFSMPSEPPLIPKLAKGGIVKAPTLALVGDNAGASTGDPEVISPLSKLQGMIDNSSNSYDTEILKQILSLLKKLYEMFLIFQNNGGNVYEFVAKMNGSVFFDEMIKQNQLYKKRHNGKSAFA